jgi:RNA polymerase sigma-70 factor (ECF subfamily)
MTGKRSGGGVANEGMEAAVLMTDRAADSRTWLESLRSVDDRRRDEAVERLHELLLRAARFEVGRRAPSAPHVERREFDDLAHQSADDALVAILAKLDDFRGESRFTTWAYKFALLEAGVKMRRRAWHDREVALDADNRPAVADLRPSPDGDAQTAELLAAIREAITTDLTDHQRRVLVAVTLDDVPIDVLAERLGSTRGALYKTLHDARRRLRAALAERGLEAP